MAIAFYRNIVKSKSCCWFAKRNLYVLGIETSCDETSTAVVSDSRKVLGEGHFSQSRLHVEAGGIIPIIAYNIHKSFIKSMVEASMNQSLLSFRNLDAIAVTVKPGLFLSLKAGLNYAKDLCTLYSKPLIPIHHMEAHALTARLIEDVKFPFLTFLISGAHCILAVAESVDKFKSLGTSLHASPGMVLDKIARKTKLKNLKKYQGLAGGAAIEAAAHGGDSTKFKFPNRIFNSHPHNNHCNFSFSGILSFASQILSDEEKKLNLGPDSILPNVNDFCAASLLAVTRHLCQRLEIAFKYIHVTELLKDDEKCLVMSGGVACNTFIRKAVKKVCDHYGYQLVVPPPKLCSDNGIMIAWNGIERLKQNLPVVQPENLSSVTEQIKCPLGEDISDDVWNKCRTMNFKLMKWDSYSDIAMYGERSESDLQKQSA